MSFLLIQIIHLWKGAYVFAYARSWYAHSFRNLFCSVWPFGTSSILVCGWSLVQTASPANTLFIFCSTRLGSIRHSRGKPLIGTNVWAQDLSSSLISHYYRWPGLILAQSHLCYGHSIPLYCLGWECKSNPPRNGHYRSFSRKMD